MYQANQKLVLRYERRSGAEFLGARVGIQRLIIPLANLSRSARGPVEGRVKDITAALGFPGEPRMRRPARRCPLADDQTNIRGAVFVHLFVKRHRFGFAVSRRARLRFRGSLPNDGKTVGNGTKVGHPLVHGTQRDLVSRSAG